MKNFTRLFVLSLSFFSFSIGFSQPVINLTPVITGLNTPVDVVNAGDGTNRLFIVQQGGVIRVFSSTFTSLGNFLTVTGISTGGERGLLSLAFHPNYSSNGYFFVYYTNSAGNLELARYKVSPDPNVADAASKTIVLTIPHPSFSNHNGGRLLFGTDGLLYLSTGDGGSAGDPNNNAQNITVLLGKILRINVNTSSSPPFYTIPAGNPFSNEIWALGLRNPFRWSFDRLTQDIWIGDVGQDNWEEIDFIQAGSPVGKNFGWRCYEGNNPYNLSGCGPVGNYTFPVYAYPTQNPSASVIGGSVYRGAAFPGLAGYYLACDFYSGNFYKIKPNGSGGWDISIQNSVQTGIGGFGETENGELYAASAFTGTVYRVEGTIVTGVSDPQSRKNFRIYPSVITTGVINTYLYQPWEKWELISLSGAVVKEISLVGRSGRVDVTLDKIPAAAYLVRISNDSKSSVQKILIQ